MLSNQQPHEQDLEVEALADQVEDLSLQQPAPILQGYWFKRATPESGEPSLKATSKRYQFANP